MNKGIIVSVQGYSSSTNNELCNSAIEAGAAAIRTDKPIQNKTVPVIGLIKVKTDRKEEQPYITPDIPLIQKVVQWADYVAIDYRMINRNLDSVSSYCRDNKIKVIADIRTIDDYFNIIDCKYHFDFIATTFSVFGKKFEPDVKLLIDLKNAGCKKIIAEGNYSRYKDVKDALSIGAHCVCIGGAISDVYKLTRRYTTIEFNN